MTNLGGSLVVAFTVATALVFLIFLVLKVDNHWDINYGHVTGPVLAFFGLASAVFFLRGLTHYARDERRPIFLYRLGVAVLFAGSFVTVYLLTKKFEFELAISFTGAMLPYMAGLLLTGVLFIVSLNLRA
jgi:hypothetical protein